MLIWIKIILFNFQSKTIREFDANYTIKLFGHNSVEEYYKKASLHDKLDLIKIPCLCLNAADDPFCLESGKYKPKLF